METPHKAAGVAVPCPETAPANVAETLDVHEIAAVFPPMRATEFEALVADIRERGQLEPVWTFEGKVIDGRHRLLACKKLGIEPRTREWDGAGSLLEFVISLNLHRRHLKESQRAMIAARMMPAFEADARHRMATRQELPPWVFSPKGRASSHAAKLLNVSEKSVRRARSVIEGDLPELVTAVDQHKIAVTTAALICERPRDEQARLLSLKRSEMIAALYPGRVAKKPAAPTPPVPEDAPAPQPKLDHAQQQADWNLLSGLTAGRSKLTKTEHGFRIEFSDQWLEELRQVMSDRERFTQLLDRGVFMTRKRNSA